MTFSSPKFSTLTHLQFGHVYKNTEIDQPTSSDVPVLPLLTHLSFFDVCAADHTGANASIGESSCRPADYYRRILEAPSRVDLHMLVVVVFPGGELYAVQLLAKRLPHLVVVVDTPGPLKSRGGEWLAGARGENGFQPEAARDGQTFYVSELRRVYASYGTGPPIDVEETSGSDSVVHAD